MRVAAILLIAAGALPLGGCLSFGEKPPPTLMTLTADAAPAAGASRTAREGETVTVFPPTVPQELATLRVPVRTGPTAVAYLKDAQWVEAPNRLFRTLLADTVAARTGRAVLDPRQSSLAPGVRLGGTLRAFGLDAQARAVVVGYDATLARGGRAAVETRRFEARVPVAAEDAGSVAAALNQAANQVAGEVAGWVGG